MCFDSRSLNGSFYWVFAVNKIQGVAYLTRSISDQENDGVVQRAIEYVNMTQMARKLQPWRVIPPVLPFSADEIDDQVGIEGKYALFQPTTIMNGCFIAAIAREVSGMCVCVGGKGNVCVWWESPNELIKNK